MSTDYASVTDFRNYTGMGTATAGTAHYDDTAIGLCLDAAALAIEQFTGRSFTTAGTAATTKYFTSTGRYLTIPDANGTAFTITGDYDDDATYETSITDFVVVTRNNDGGVPWSVVKFGSGVAMPGASDDLSIAGLWGWSATPATVELATLIQAHRYWLRKSSPTGSFGASEFGNAVVLPWKTTLDPDVQVMLAPYVRGWVAL